MDTPQDNPIIRLQTFVVALLLFAIFGVLGYLLTAFGGSVGEDPGAGLRLEARAAAEQSSAEILEPVGWVSPGPDQLEAAAAAIAARPAVAPSEIVVPGSPTAIEQGSAAAPEEQDQDQQDGQDEPATDAEAPDDASSDEQSQEHDPTAAAAE